MNMTAAGRTSLRVPVWMVALIMSSSAGWAMDTLDFTTLSRSGAVDARVENGRGRWLGSGHRGQLYLLASGGAGVTEARALGEPVPFLDDPQTGEGTGYLFGGVVDVPTDLPSRLLTLELRAWEAALGSSYEEVQARSLGGYGSSDPFQVTVPGPGRLPSFPVGLAGLRGFHLVQPISRPVRVRIGVVPIDGGRIEVEPEPFSRDGPWLTYWAGQTVRLNPVPAPGHQWLEWGDGTVWMERVRMLTLVEGLDEVEVTAVFQPEGEQDRIRVELREGRVRIVFLGMMGRHLMVEARDELSPGPSGWEMVAGWLATGNYEIWEEGIPARAARFYRARFPF